LSERKRLISQMEEQANTRLCQQDQDFKKILLEKQKDVDQLRTRIEMNQKSHVSEIEDLELKHSKEVIKIDS
jgi:hypothetical protein